MSLLGDPVHLEVDDDEASGGIAFTIYPAGSTTAITLGSTQYLVITDIIFVSTDGGTYAIVADADGAGEIIAKGEADALGGLVSNFVVPFTCAKGVTPKLIAADGQVTCVLQGYIQNA